MSEPQLMNPWFPENQPESFDQWSIWDQDDWFQQVEDANARAQMRYDGYGLWQER